MKYYVLIVNNEIQLLNESALQVDLRTSKSSRRASQLLVFSVTDIGFEVSELEHL
jgi:hypothetical protein